MTDKTNELALTATTGYAMLADRDIMKEVMSEDCLGLDFSFDRVKIPAGGGTAFEVPSGENEDSEMTKELVGVIVYNHPAYAYYRNSYAGGSNPPDCGSMDGVNGRGNPGGKCADCPYNKFGSNGQGKQCKNKRQLYILREGEIFPIVLSLPTGSLKSFTNYVKNQLSRGRKLNQVVTKITLKKANNASGIAFSQAVFTFDRMLSPDERAGVGGITESVKAYAANHTPASYEDDDPFVDVGTGEVIEPLK